ncbi:MAG TPA: lytic transglycosylase domain-containing protein [Rhodospirillaceae bacterium]|nr:lytic transglycosylase domain-containing protein [Rhodospirillaceae bacterium]
MLKGKLLPAFVALTLVAAAHSAAASQVKDEGADTAKQVAAITGTAGKLGRQAGIPLVLSEADVTRYRAALDASKRGNWAVAEREISHLHDPLLVGHLRAERILAPGYTATPEELRDWLADNADLPQAQDVYALARLLLGGRTAGLKPPAKSVAVAVRTAEDWEDFAVDSSRQISAAERRRLSNLKDRLRSMIRQGSYDTAGAFLQSATGGLDRLDADELKTVLAQALFSDGRDAEALHWAQEAANGSGDVLPEANWVAGLARWRSGQHAAAARNFEAVANAAEISDWLASSGAYWAARANIAARQPEVVNHWLQQAAAFPRTFYGHLARRALGQDIQYFWETRPFTDVDGEVLLRIPAARRALALLQLGDSSRAEDELEHLLTEAGPALTQSMLSLANAADMPALAVKAGGMAEARDGRLHDVADYPLPDWRPPSGWSVDRALVLAIARQESSFNPKAKSPCGAVGLMQLMPRTAKSLGGGGRLTDPAVNLELGQRYVRILLDDDSIKGNLLFLAASYNSGPGNLQRWQQSIHHDGDALLFLESIPMHETRAFVERVMTNYWAYRNRLSLPTPSLDAIAAGDWPMYDGADNRQRMVKHGKN